MGKVVVTEEYLEDIADAIREKGVAGTFTPAQMGNGVRNIQQGGGGTTDYDQLSNKPQINGITLTGNKTTQDLNIVYGDIGGKPTLGTASAKDVPATGDASSSQVVMGNDSRLTDSRPASDVSSWAKQSTKPTYTASEVGAIATTQKGVASGVAELDANGKVLSSQLPSYVDDVIEGYYDTTTDRFYTESTFENVIPPESGKSWVDVASNKSYRWTGTVYSRVDEGVQLGETSGSAYRGDRGKVAYDHSQTVGNPHGTTKSDVGLGNVPNVSTNDQEPTFTEATTRNNIASGEKLSVIFGKIQKFFNDLKTVAFSGSYTDLSSQPQINSNTLTGNKTTSDLGINATNVMMSDGVTSVEEKIGNVRMTMLWTNPHPTAEFVAQNITLSSNDYNMLLVVGYVSTGSLRNISAIISKNSHGLLSIYQNEASKYFRNFNCVSNTEYSVSTGYSGNNTDTSVCIPLTIYGIKLT